MLDSAPGSRQAVCAPRSPGSGWCGSVCHPGACRILIGSDRFVSGVLLLYYSLPLPNRLSQPSLTKTAVRPFCPVRPRSSRPSLPLPFQASISCSEGSHSPFSHSCLIKIKSACTSLKIRYRPPRMATLDLTETRKPCFADSILPQKEEHRHSQ